MRNNKPQICVVMPVFNEALCLEACLRSWVRVLDGFNFSLVAVNDGSTDGSGKLLERLAEEYSRLKVITQKNAGHGKAIHRGYEEAMAQGAEWIFQVDSDRQFFEEDFFLLWPKRLDSPVVLAYRKNRADGLHRKIASWALSWLILGLFGFRVRDPNIPFRLLSQESLRTILDHIPPNCRATNIIMGIWAKRLSLGLAEVPVRHLARKTGLGSLRSWSLVRYSSQVFRELFILRFSKDYAQVESLAPSHSSARPGA